MRSSRRWAMATALVVALLAAVILALAFTASPASAFSNWQHNGAMGCESCHSAGTPTDASCTNCHAGFQSFPGQTCWSCHAPGQDTSTLSAPSSACSQECHLWNAAEKQYVTPFSHGTNPHRGSGGACLNCHSTSVGIADPGSSPHHSGVATGFGRCGVCHSAPQKHVGKVACTSCHTNAEAFHTFKASSPGFKRCGACHSMRHAGTRVPVSKCAACHKGSSGRPAQHSVNVTKKRACGVCHSKALHASRVSNAVKSCRTCHAGRYHAAQRLPSNSVCLNCHSTAYRHANGFRCTLCHRSAIHDSTPSAIN